MEVEVDCVEANYSFHLCKNTKAHIPRCRALAVIITSITSQNQAAVVRTTAGEQLISSFHGASHKRIPVRALSVPVTIEASADTTINVRFLMRVPDDSFETRLFNPHHDEFATATTHMCIPYSRAGIPAEFTLDGTLYCDGHIVEQG